MGDYTCYKKTLPAPQKERPSQPPLKGGDIAVRFLEGWVNPFKRGDVTIWVLVRVCHPPLRGTEGVFG